MCVCWSLLELSFGFGLKWASTPLGPLRILFKGARTPPPPPKPREHFERRLRTEVRSIVVFFLFLLEEWEGRGEEDGETR